ncbi:hypothetical protein [Burkholderia metallica]|nr:hypothetical protein [Burkholderia metallica]MCA8023403.1 hypothetical protein [Burkholderia metallica]
MFEDIFGPAFTAIENVSTSGKQYMGALKIDAVKQVSEHGYGAEHESER